jgi:hypothetical protein
VFSLFSFDTHLHCFSSFCRPPLQICQVQLPICQHCYYQIQCTVCIVHLFSEPNVMVEWLTLLLCIWEFAGSNLGLETGYPNRGFFVVFLWVNARLMHKFGHNHSFPNPLKFIIHLPPFHMMLYSLSY